MHDVIRLYLDAPRKPAPGEACNGCGVCCASEPCPIGIVVSRRRTGACGALHWHAADARYRCGVALHPARHLPAALRWAAPLLARAALRYISAGSGCDCSLVPTASKPVVADAIASTG